MAGSRATGALRLLWRHRQQLWPAPLPDPDCQSLAWSDMAARAKATNVVGPFQCSSARQPAAAAAARARLARTSGLIRGHSSEEPDAGCDREAGVSLPVQVWSVQSRAGRTGASLAGVAATRGPKRRQRLDGVWN